MALISMHQARIVAVGRTCFDQFTWTVEAGQHWVVRGPNGSGKTLLLQTLAGQHSPVDGRLDFSFVNGTTWDERHRQRQQAVHLIPAQTNQALLQVKGRSFYQQRYFGSFNEDVPSVDAFLGHPGSRLSDLPLPASFELSQVLPLPVTYLSNGQLRKLILVRSLLSSPRVLLLDCPYVGLDTESRSDLNAFLDEVITQNEITVIMADNQDDELPSAIGHELVLNRFAIEREGPRKQAGAVSPSTDWRPPPPPPVNPDATPVIEFDQITVRYGEKRLIEDFNWTIRTGEKWALLGKNGSGKTTLLSLIYGDHPQAYTNAVSLFGTRRGRGDSIWDIKQRMNCLLPEMMTFFQQGRAGSFTVWQSLIQSGKIPYVTASEPPEVIEERARDLLAFFGVSDLADTPVGRLSSGQLQLHLFMQTFLHERIVYLLDEPFQFMDPATRDLAKATIANRLSEEHTLVMVTHHPDDFTGLVDRVKELSN